MGLTESQQSFCSGVVRTPPVLPAARLQQDGSTNVGVKNRAVTDRGFSTGGVRVPRRISSLWGAVL